MMQATQAPTTPAVTTPTPDVLAARQAAAQAAGPAAVYRGLVDQREILGEQLQEAQNLRQNLVQEMAQPQQSAATKASIEKRIANADARITELDKQIAASDAAVSTASAVPGATVRPPELPRTGPPEEVFFLAGMFMFIVFLPLSFAFARRVWRRSARAEVTLPPEMSQRMESLERGVEAIAIEVERIGEGQRFVTQALAGRGEAAPRALAAKVEERR